MGMPLSPALFNRQLRQMGQSVTWRRAALCPCRDTYSGQAAMGCPSCDGVGVTWEAPVPAWTGVVSQRVARAWGGFSAWESGDEALSIPSASPLYRLGENDRVLMQDSSEPFQTVMVRDGTERLRWPVVELDRCFWLRPGDQAQVEGDLPDVAEDGRLSWPNLMRAPDPGVQFSLRGRRLLEFFIFQELPQDRAHIGGLALPRRVVARRFDLFGRSSLPEPSNG